MKILVVGGGGREHAIIKKIKENKEVEKIYAIPGNGGIAQDAECIAIPANEIEKITEISKGATTYEVELPRYLVAPIKKGDTVGKIKIFIDGELIAESPLVSLDDSILEKKRPFDFFR